MPKTAGLSFRASLEEHFGQAFAADYSDYPLAQSPESRRLQAQEHGDVGGTTDIEGIECIHGHFLPLKYHFLADDPQCRFVTWLRDPVARLVSHYDYWQAAYNPGADSTSALHARVVEEGWTLEQFCLAPELRNIYTEFLWGFPLERLDFVGITEHFAEDLRYFSTVFLGNKLQPRHVNRQSGHSGGEGKARLAPEIDEQVRRYHSADVALFRWALQLREARLRAHRQVSNANA